MWTKHASRLAQVALILLMAHGPTAPAAPADLDEDLLRSLLAEIRLLRDRVEQLEKRIAELEGGQAGTGGAGAAPPTAAAGEPVLQLESIETSVAGGAEEVGSLRDEAASLRREAEELRLQAAEAAHRPTGWPYWSRDRQRAWDLEHDRLAAKYREEALVKEREAKRLEGEAKRIEREAAELRQRITGWDGQRTVILDAARDLSSVLSQLQPDAFITWIGQRLELSSTHERWEVTVIREVAAPAGFTARPAPTGSGRPRAR